MTALCCRILSGSDFSDVLAQLRQSGYNFEDEVVCFASRVSLSEDRVDRRRRESNSSCVRPSSPGMCSRKRPTSGRTVRTVDSSLERMQVKVSGFTTESRYVVACNGRRVPLHRTGEPANPERRWRAYGIAREDCRRRYTLQFPCTRPLSSTLSTAGKSVRLADVLTMRGHPTVTCIQRGPSAQRKPKTAVRNALRSRTMPPPG